MTLNSDIMNHFVINPLNAKITLIEEDDVLVVQVLRILEIWVRITIIRVIAVEANENLFRLWVFAL